MHCFRLRNQIQHYSWGSRTFLAELRGSEPSTEPEAELWVGAHPALPSHIELDGAWVPLDEALSQCQQLLLGSPDSATESDSAPAPALSILLKILAIQEPLSLQAHPTAKQALEGFEREQAAGLKLSDPRRNYRDPNAKPEVICALTAFEALSGFRQVVDIANDLDRLSLSDLLPIDPSEMLPLRSFFARLCQLGQDQVEELQERTQRLEPAPISDQRLEERVAWIKRLSQTYPGDQAVTAPLFLNLVQLQPGECLFTGAGTLHTYLDGAGVELMSSSDNVLRAGLTPKHVNTAELLRIVDFNPRPPARPSFVETTTGHYTLEETGAPFGLDQLRVRDQLTLQTSSRTELWLAVEGRAQVTEESGATATLSAGDALLVAPPATTLQVIGRATVYRAYQPGISDS